MKSILVGWDGGGPSRDALALALLLARECEFGLRVIHCYPGHEGYPTPLGLMEEIISDAQKTIDDMPQEARDAGATSGLVLALSASEGLQYEAERMNAHMIVLGSTHRGRLGRLVPGAVAENLLHGAPCAVTVAPAGFAGAGAASLRTIAVAFDGSGESRAAVEEAVRLAQVSHARLNVISVAPQTPFGWGAVEFSYDELHRLDREYRRETLDELIASLPSGVHATARFRDGEPAREIVAECETGVDLLVLGSRGYGALRRAMLGGVSTTVVRTASCPVAIIPHRVSRSAEEDDAKRTHARPSSMAG